MVKYPNNEQLEALRKAGKYHIMHSLIWELYGLGYKPKLISEMLGIKHSSVRAESNRMKSVESERLTAIPWTVDALRAYVEITRDEGLTKEAQHKLHGLAIYILEILPLTIEREEITEELEKEPDTPLQKMIDKVIGNLEPQAKKKFKEDQLNGFWDIDDERGDL